MSSTNKTSSLGLNDWLETDRPKRADFVRDNRIIDSVVGNHLANEDMHFTTLLEKMRASEPFKIGTVFGTGGQTVYRPGFEPTLAIVFKKNAPFCENAGNYTKINAAVVVNPGSSGGAEIVQDAIILNQSTAASDGVFYNLNELYSEYIVISFR